MFNPYTVNGHSDQKQSNNFLEIFRQKDFFLFEATPIYLLVLCAQEVGNEPFWNKKKVEKCDFFYLIIFFRV